MSKYGTIKQTVLSYYEDLEKAAPEDILQVLDQYLSESCEWKCSYPFRELMGKEEICRDFWKPLKESLTCMQRRMDIFFGGNNVLAPEETWVMSMGHFMGLFDRDFLGIRATGKMASLRYAEFSCVDGGKITKTGLFLDLIGLMCQAGMNPLPPMTGQYFIYPGPRMHNGLLFEDAPEEEGRKTLEVVESMTEILDRLNRSGSLEPPTEEDLARSWSQDMIWYGPAGVGATYTIPRYIRQHTGPFRQGLTDKKFNGHCVRFAEGNFAAFFGWPNLSNRCNGWLGLPVGKEPASMQVVDVYCRQGDKLSENWVIIDIPYWLKQQGVDVFRRTAGILNAGSSLT